MSRLICAADALPDGGDGQRFMVDAEGGPVPAFVVRWHGVVYAFCNVCPHVGAELDWNPGRFFDDSGNYLICALHGALFEPDTGECVAGPCAGMPLSRLAVVERDGGIFLEAREA